MKNNRLRLIQLSITLLLLVLAWSGANAQSAQVQGVRMWPAPDNTRLVFDVSSPVEHTVFVLSNPDRLVIDIKNAGLVGDIDQLDYSGSLLKGIRTGVRDGRHLRVVLDLKEPVRPKSFVLRPNEEYGNRLVVDLHKSDTSSSQPTRSVQDLSSGKARDVIIAVDAGHGGEDPGALGPSRTREKDVVLAIARKLSSLIEKEYGMRPVMIRDGDYYISLDQRVEKARKHRADLFVSIHADAFPDRRARGASVYTLSRRGASSEHARLLAEKENSSDLIGGVSLDDKDDLLAAVLLDLSQTATNEASVDVASRVLGRLKKVARLHRRDVEHAGFRVLKSPDLPSILVETAFISNPTEERQLRSSAHQEAVAKAIMEGVRAYFHNNAPPGTIIAERDQKEHVISRGDTLSGIASRYRVSVDSLRSLNGLKSNILKTGDILLIPQRSDS